MFKRPSFKSSSSVTERDRCDVTANPEETMESFTTESKKALWHVYDMLKSANSTDVHISQLKVITSNIGRILGFDKSENLLDRDGMTSMDFDTFFDIIKTDLIEKQKPESDATVKPLGDRLSDVIRTCWTFCQYERTHKSKVLGTDHCLVLWRLFNFFCETDMDGHIVIPVVLHRDEAVFLCKEFIEITGQKNKEKAVNEIAEFSDDETECLKFGEFQNIFEKCFLEGLSPSAVTYGLTQLHEKFILEVLAKGMLQKRGFNVKNWKERWLILSKKELKYFVNQSEKSLKGTIVFTKECDIEIPPERTANKPNRFVLHTSKKPYEINAPDLKTKHEWISAIQIALDHINKDTNIHQEAARKRCQARLEKKRQLEEEARKRKEEADLLETRQRELDEEKRKREEDEELLRKRLGELEEEKRLRAEAEARANEEQTLREIDRERLRQLELIKEELERLLAEERQAKKDEEIVRALQARLLEEEFQKREELEKLKQQQEDLLKAEREQKAVLQSDREEQERLLSEAKEKLEQLERDKKAAAEQMQEAAEKLQKAEKDRKIMEDKVSLWKRPVGLARPIIPTVDPHVTHRGLGAFCDRDFQKREGGGSFRRKESETEEKTSDKDHEKQIIDDEIAEKQRKETALKSESSEIKADSDENLIKLQEDMNGESNEKRVDPKDISEQTEESDKSRSLIDSGVDLDNNSDEHKEKSPYNNCMNDSSVSNREDSNSFSDNKFQSDITTDKTDAIENDKLITNAQPVIDTNSNEETQE